LHPDHKCCADHGGKDLRHQSRSSRAYDPEQRYGDGDARGGGRRSHRRHDAITAEPSCPALQRQHVYERRSQKERHECNRKRHRGNAHGICRCGIGRRGEDEVEIRTRVEGAGHGFHRL
jgi:hypothetical protein